MRLRPTFRPSLPVDLTTRVSDLPSGSAFQSTCDRRHLSIFRPAFRLTSGLRLRPVFRLSLPVHVRLSPSANVPALPPNLTSDSHRTLRSPGAALWFIRDRRRECPSGPACDHNIRLSSFAVSLWRLSCCPAACAADQPSSLPADPTFDSPIAVSLRRCFPANLRLAPPTNLPAQPVDPTSDSSTAVFSGGAFQLLFDLRLGSTFQLAFYFIFDFRLRLLVRRRLRIQRPTYCVSSVEKNLRSALPVHASANLRISVHFPVFCPVRCAPAEQLN